MVFNEAQKRKQLIGWIATGSRHHRRLGGGGGPWRASGLCFGHIGGRRGCSLRTWAAAAGWRGLRDRHWLQRRDAGANRWNLWVPLGHTSGAAADHPAHRGAGHENPANVGHWLASDEAAFIEQPFVVTVKLLERIVRQDDGVRLFGNLQHERIATTNSSGGRRHQFVVFDRFVEFCDLARVDAMAEGGVDDNSDDVCRVLLHVCHHGIVQLLQARQGAAFGGQVGSINDNVSRHNAINSIITEASGRVSRPDQRPHRC